MPVGESDGDRELVGQGDAVAEPQRVAVTQFDDKALADKSGVSVSGALGDSDVDADADTDCVRRGDEVPQGEEENVPRHCCKRSVLLAQAAQATQYAPQPLAMELLELVESVEEEGGADGESATLALPVAAKVSVAAPACAVPVAVADSVAERGAEAEGEYVPNLATNAAQ